MGLAGMADAVEAPPPAADFAFILADCSASCSAIVMGLAGIGLAWFPPPEAAAADFAFIAAYCA